MNANFQETKRLMSPGLKNLYIQLGKNIMNFPPEKLRELGAGKISNMYEFCKFYEIDYNTFIEESKKSGFLDNNGMATPTGLRSGLYMIEPFNQFNLN